MKPGGVPSRATLKGHGTNKSKNRAIIDKK
jgi:hypothetical protein